MRKKEKSIEKEKMPQRNPPKFFNRELSWIQFNRRVLEEAMDSSVPLLERLKFLCIVSSNFDEFFQVRVSYVKRQISNGDEVNCPSGLKPSQQLEAISAQVKEIQQLQYQTLYQEILPGLEKAGIQYRKHREWDTQQIEYLARLFEEEIFPVLTPIRINPGSDFSSIKNLRLHVAYRLRKLSGVEDGEEGEERMALVQVPASIPRVVHLPAPEGKVCFTFLEDIIQAFGGRLFLGYEVIDSLVFRLARDADLGVDEERDDDFVDAMVEVIRQREQSPAVRLTYVPGSTFLLAALTAALDLSELDLYGFPGPLDLGSLMELVSLPGFDSLRDPPWRPISSQSLPEDEPYWSVLSTGDILLHHPYESFQSVVNFLQEAAKDPQVLAIKITLYRTSGDSPIVKALERAAKNKKQVTALVELKARFDEERNIEWASRLEKAGVIVIYGVAHLKVHAKALLVIRKEGSSMRRYAHLSTGNYNERTARLYTDIGLLTSREDLTYELSLFFNAVTGYSAIPNLRRLCMAPINLKTRLLTLIEREIERSTPESPGFIMAKMNSLADLDIIKALYRASQAGVRIWLNVRGICMLVPGVPGLSEHITVVSIVDRLLEHSRIYYFHNGGSEEVYCSSADWMPRNLERRIELMFPVEQKDIKRRVIQLLHLFFKDNQKARVLLSDGTYQRKRPSKKEEPFRVQQHLYEEVLKSSQESVTMKKKEFQVRRKFPAT
ncbi:MAG: polyphosphate kinase 1 [Spirochaetales bacterium]